MADLAYPTTQMPSLITLNLDHGGRQGSLNVGADVSMCQPCYVAGSDGKVYPTNGATSAATARFRGVADTSAKAAQNQTVTLMHGCEIAWPNTFTPGVDLFISNTAGTFANASGTNGTTAVGYVIDNSRIYIFHIN